MGSAVRSPGGFVVGVVENPSKYEMSTAIRRPEFTASERKKRLREQKPEAERAAQSQVGARPMPAPSGRR